MITTKLFKIRTIEQDDIDTISAWNTPEFRGEFQEFQFESRQELIMGYNDNGFCGDSFKMVAIEVEGDIVGLFYLNFLRAGLVGIGVCLHDTKRKSGLGTAVTKAMVEHIFSNYDVARIQADTDINNKPARRVLEKAGFVEEGIMRRYRYHHGRYNDSVLYSVVREG